MARRIPSVMLRPLLLHHPLRTSATSGARLTDSRTIGRSSTVATGPVALSIRRSVLVAMTATSSLLGWVLGEGVRGALAATWAPGQFPEGVWGGRRRLGEHPQGDQ